MNGVGVSISRKEAIELVPVTEKGVTKGYIPKVKTPSGRTLMELKHTRVFGYYNLVIGLIRDGRLERLDMNGNPKEPKRGTATYIDWDEFREIREF